MTFEEIKNKIKKDPNFVKTEEFANWRDNNINNLSQVIDLIGCLPKDMGINISWFFKDDTSEIEEDCITHIQRKRKVGYLEAKQIFESMKNKNQSNGN